MKDFRHIGLSSDNPAVRGRSSPSRPAKPARQGAAARPVAPARGEGLASTATRLAERLAAKIDEAKAEVAKAEAAKKANRPTTPTRTPATQVAPAAAVQPRAIGGHLMKASGVAMMFGGLFLLMSDDGHWPAVVSEVVAPILIVVGFVDMAIGSALIRAARRARR